VSDELSPMVPSDSRADAIQVARRAFFRHVAEAICRLR
jgi:hypothetical protein